MEQNIESWGEILKHWKLQHKAYSKSNYLNNKYLHGEATATSFDISLIKYTRKFFHIRKSHHEESFKAYHQ